MFSNRTPFQTVRQILTRFIGDSLGNTDPVPPLRSEVVPKPATTLRIRTLNSWNIPVAPYCGERAECMDFTGVDVIGFQEVPHSREVNALIRRGREAGLNYCHTFHGGMTVPLWGGLVAPGMLILSRYPIVDTIFHRFPVNGKPHKLTHLDFYGAKGVGLCRVDTGNGIVDVFVTHLHAKYNHEADEYEAHRLHQAYELARFVELTHNQDNLCVVLGDFNLGNKELGMRLVQSYPELIDSYSFCHPNDPKPTHNLPENTFYETDEDSERLDYVLFRLPVSKHAGELSPTARPKPPGWCLTASEVRPLRISKDSPHPELAGMSISDHEALDVVFEYLEKDDHRAVAVPLPSSIRDATPEKLAEACGFPSKITRSHLREAEEIMRQGILLCLQDRQNHLFRAGMWTVLYFMLPWLPTALTSAITSVGAASVGYFATPLIWVLGLASLFRWVCPIMSAAELVIAVSSCRSEELGLRGTYLDLQVQRRSHHLRAKRKKPSDEEDQ